MILRQQIRPRLFQPQKGLPVKKVTPGRMSVDGRSPMKQPNMSALPRMTKAVIHPAPYTGATNLQGNQEGRGRLNLMSETQDARARVIGVKTDPRDWSVAELKQLLREKEARAQPVKKEPGSRQDPMIIE